MQKIRNAMVSLKFNLFIENHDLNRPYLLDDNECELGTHNCRDDYECKNTIGSFRCYKRTTTITTTTPSPTTTSTTIQAYYADRKLLAQPCPTGFKRNHLGACVDIDECFTRDICPRHQKCINTNGSYKCQNLNTCSSGYRYTMRGECVGKLVFSYPSCKIYLNKI